VRRWYPLLLLLTAVIFAAVVYDRLPERVTIHWNASGEPDGWSSRLLAVTVLPAVGVLVWALMRGLPRIDPRRAHYAKFAGTYDLFVDAVLTFMLFLYVITLGAALGWPVRIERMVPIGIGVLFILLGNVLPRARSNWWFGIRTPWTLSNERVWTRTHRVGGFLMVAAGIASIVSAFVPGAAGIWAFLVAVLIASLGSIIYSYFAWKQETSS